MAFKTSEMEMIKESRTRGILQIILQKSGTSLTTAVQRMSEAHPEVASTTQNISHKLKRDTVTFNEMCYLAEACGYEIDMCKSKNRRETYSTIKDALGENSESNKDDGSGAYVGYQTKNLGFILFVAPDLDIAVKAVRAYAHFTEDDQSPKNEFRMLKEIEKRFNVTTHSIPDISDISDEKSLS